jgi:DNA-binding transcriptional ArsR family regulator
VDEIPEVYNLETVEQMRAIADDLRMRIVQALARQPMTVTQLGALLKEQPSKIHYHVRELERVGLVRLVETREKGGILEKYYRSVAMRLNVPGTLLSHLSADEQFAAAEEYLQIVTQGFMRAFRHGMAQQVFEGEDAPAVGIIGGQLWITNAELLDLSKHFSDLIKPYREPRGLSNERERSVQLFVYDALPAEETASSAQRPAPAAAPSTPSTHGAPGPPAAPRPPAPVARRRTVAAGATTFSRAELEEVVNHGETLDITVMGYCQFTEDVPAELVERAIDRFHCRGVLAASPAVREALKRKEV